MVAYINLYSHLDDYVKNGDIVKLNSGVTKDIQEASILNEHRNPFMSLFQAIVNGINKLGAYLTKGTTEKPWIEFKPTASAIIVKKFKDELMAKTPDDEDLPPQQNI